MEDTLENRKKFRFALKEARLGNLEPIERMQFISGWTTIHMDAGLRLT